MNPLLWLAEGMAARGHEPAFLITPHYSRLVQRRGFSWVPVGTEEEFVRFARDPRLWHNAQGTKMVVQGMLETLPVYREGFATAGSDFDVVVLSTMAMGAASVAESIGLPRVTLHLQPALFRSVYDCPVFMEQLAWLPRSPRWVKRGFFSLVDAVLWEAARKTLNAFRKGLDLPPLGDFYAEAFHGAEGVAALFPDWFAAPQPDWPPKVRQFGFPISIGPPRPLPENLEAFLGSGEPPVAWTHGSANFDIQHFQSRALCGLSGAQIALLAHQPGSSRRTTPCRHLSHRARALRRPFSTLPRGSPSWRDWNHHQMHHGGCATTHHSPLSRPARQRQPGCQTRHRKSALVSKNRPGRSQRDLERTHRIEKGSVALQGISGAHARHRYFVRSLRMDGGNREEIRQRRSRAGEESGARVSALDVGAQLTFPPARRCSRI